MCEGFELQYDQERADKGKKQKEKLFQNVDEISEGTKKQCNQLSMKEDEDILYDTHSMEN